MDPDATWEWCGVPSSCALLGGFAIGARVFVADTVAQNAKMSESACTLSTPGYWK